MPRRDYKTPFGLNRWVLLAWYTLMMVLTSYLIGAVDPLRELLLMNGTTQNESENIVEQKATIESIVNVGFSSATLLSLPVANYTAFRQPRMTGLTALVAFAIGMMFLFLGDVSFVNYAGIILLGGSFSASFNAHVTLTALFPTTSDIVFDWLGAAPDLSTLVPLFLLWTAENIGGPNSVETAVQIFVGCVAFLMIFHFFLLPSTPYADVISKKFKKRMEETPPKERTYMKKITRVPGLARFAETFRKVQDEDVVLNDLTMMQQVVHPLYILLIIGFSIHLLRKYYVLSTFRFTVLRYADMTDVDPSYASFVIEAMNFANGLSWIPTAFLTRLFLELGTFAGSITTAVLAFLGSATMCVPNVHVQWVTVISLGMTSSIIYGLLYTWIGDYFGMRHMSRLQGTVMLIAGSSCLCFPYIWESLGQPFIEESPLNLSGSTLWHDSHYAMLVLTTINLLLPLFEYRSIIPTMRRLRNLRDEKRMAAREELIEAELQAPKTTSKNYDEMKILTNAMLMMKQQQLMQSMTAGSMTEDTSQTDELLEKALALMKELGINTDKIISEVDHSDSSSDEEADLEGAFRKILTRGSVAPLEPILDEKKAESIDEPNRPSSRWSSRITRQALHRLSRLSSGTAVLNEENLATVAAASLVTTVSSTNPDRSPAHSESSDEGNLKPEDAFPLLTPHQVPTRMITSSHAPANLQDSFFRPEGQPSRNESNRPGTLLPS